MMATAYRCDRCGQCFDPYSAQDSFVFSQFENPVYFRGKDKQENRITGTMLDSGYIDGMRTSSRRIDLCETCTREFWKFMSRHGLIQDLDI